MGKPLIHMIPSQEAKLRGTSFSNYGGSSASDELRQAQVSIDEGAESKGKQIPEASDLTKGKSVRRSTTNASNESKNTLKSNYSNDSGACSFVHSNASLSSSEEQNMAALRGEPSTKNISAVPNSITTSKVKLAIQNYEQNIEITRQGSASTSSSKKRSSVFKMKTHSPKKNHGSKNSPKRSTFVKSAVPSTNRIWSNIVEETETNKTGDESTISSMSSRSMSFGSNRHFAPTEDHGVIPRFEVLLDETPENDAKPTVTASKKSTAFATKKPIATVSKSRRKIEEPSKVKKASPKVKHRTSADTNNKVEEHGIKRNFSPKEVSPNGSNVRPRVIVSRQRSQSNKTRQRELLNGVSSSNLFFSAMDKHIETRLTSKKRPKRIRKVVHSIEVVKSPQVKEDKVLVCEDVITSVSDSSRSRRASNSLDLNRVLSPSKTKGVRQIPTVAAASFKVPPQPKSPQVKKKKMYSITGGELVVDEIDQYEAIELKESGSVISTESQKCEKEAKNVSKRTPTAIKTRDETVKKPYRLVRLDDSKIVSLLQQNRGKASTKSRISKGFLRMNKRTKNSSSSSSTLSRNPTRIVSEDKKTGAIELLRTPTRFGSSNTFSYDENEEDSIIKHVSPAPSPIPSMENLCVVGENDDIEVVAPSLKQEGDAVIETPPPAEEESIDRIVSIIKLDSKDENVSSRSLPYPIDTATAVRTMSSKVMSAPPKKIEPVVETPSNRVEGPADVTRADSYSAKSSASVHSKESVKSSADTSSHQVTPNPPVELEIEAPRNGDQLVFVGNELSNPQIKKSAFVPKIPASKRDTASKKGKILKKSSYKTDQKSASFSKDSPRRVKIHVQSVQKPDVNVQNIEISSVSTPTSTDSDENDLVALKKYGAMVVKKPSFTIETAEEMSSDTSNDSFESKCVVSFNVLGVAGIVVDRQKCRDFTGNNISPSPPEQVTAVVGVSKCDQDSIENVTTFSSTLVHAPNTKDVGETPQNEVQRHIAVWTSNHSGVTPGSIVKSKTLDLKSSDKNFLDLKVALAKNSESVHHAAVIIGTARIEITEDMIGESNIRTIDLPVSQVPAKSPLSPRDDKNVLLLRTASKPIGDVRKLSVDEFSSFGIEDNESLASVYAIDPSGDSMIRVQIEVKELDPSTRVGKVERSGSFTNITDRTAETARSEESSIPSGTSQKETEDKPVELASRVDEDASFQPVSRKDEVSAVYQETTEVQGPGCKIFGRKIVLPACARRSKGGLASRIDDRIEDMAERIFSTTCTAPKRDEASIVGDATYYTGATGTTQRNLLEEIPAVSPVPTMTELRDLAKEIALSSGEFFFKKKGDVAHERAFSEDEDDDEHSGVGSATLASSTKKTISSRSKDSLGTWELRSDIDDDGDTYTSGGSDASEESLSINQQEPVKFGFDQKRRVMSESNKFDLGSPSDDIRFSLGRSFDGYAREDPHLEVEGEDEESISKGKQALVDDIVDEDNNDYKILRENSGKPSIPSVVENIAEVLSIGGKACGYFSAEDVDPKGTSLIWNRQTGEVEIPKTVDQSDHQSVGELTAMTLEKDEIKEKNRELLFKRLGLPKEILSWSSGGKSEDEEKSQSDSIRAASPKPENYFAEYEDGAEGARSIYGSKSEPSKQDETDFEEKKQKVVVETIVDDSGNAPVESNLKPNSGDRSEVQSV